MNLSDAERQELMTMQRSRTMAVGRVRRARLVLLLDEGATQAAIKSELRCDSRFISTWKSRFGADRLAGLYARHAGRAPRRDLARLEARVLNYTLQRKPKDGSTHRSSRKLAAQLGLPFMTVQRIWRKHDVRPHLLERHMVSNDPDFEAEAADVIGLYLNPPTHAAVFCVDEKTAIQALDRRDRMLPLSPGRAESHGFEYKRNGALSLFAALNTATGSVLGKTAARHTSAQFVAFLADVVSSQTEGKEIHVICDRRQQPQDACRTGLLGRAYERGDALHAHLLVLAQPGSELVCLNPARHHHARRVHERQRPGQKTHALHPSVQQRPETAAVEVR